MIDDRRLELSTSSSPSPPPPTSGSSLRLRPRREPFEYGLLPIPNLIFADGTKTLASIKKFFGRSSSPSNRIDASAVAEILQIPADQATLVLDTLDSVLPSDADANVEIEGTVDVSDLLLFLYVQNYKRLLPKTHKDSAAVADVWPSTSAFDGYLSVLSPLQLIRSNSRRFVPSQADEEAHQLSYLQKHIANMLTLLAEPVEREGDESLILSSERFEHLGFLIQCGEKGCEHIPLSHAVPFFANLETEMPATPVPLAQIEDWILQNIAASLEHTTDKLFAKENGPSSASELDMNMADGCTNTTRGRSGTSPIGISVHTNASFSKGQTLVEGISKASVVKQAYDVKGSSVKVLNCHDAVIYILAPLRYATVYGCSDAIIVLGAIGKALRVEHCERVHVITAVKRLCIDNCRECVFYLGVNQRPLFTGDNHKLHVAPYNTFYSQLNEHMTQVGVNTNINRWNEPLVLGMVDPHDSLSHPAGVSDAPAESATCLEPDQFNNFLIPNSFGGKTSNPTKDNPFPLPEIYVASQKKHHLVLNDVLQAIRDVQIEEDRKQELACTLHVHFKDWLYASGNIRLLYSLQCD